MYFKGNEAEQYSFLRIPRILIKDERFKEMSLEAKMLYGLMLEKMSLSVKNKWIDKENRVFIYYSTENIMDDLGCGKGKCTKILAELDIEKGYGLIERKRQGLGKPDKIYVQDFVHYTGCKQDDEGKSENKKSENRTSANPITEPAQAQETDTSYIDMSYIEQNNIQSINPCDTKEMDEIDMTNMYREIIKENISLDESMEVLDDSQKQKLQEIYEIICDVVSVKRKTIRIEGTEYPYETVKARYLMITEKHVLYVMDCLDKTTTKIKNIRAYLTTALYHAPTTFRNYIDQTVQHDMYGGGWQEKGVLPE